MRIVGRRPHKVRIARIWRVECSCGTIFEAKKSDVHVGELGSRWLECPECERAIDITKLEGK